MKAKRLVVTVVLGMMVLVLVAGCALLNSPPVARFSVFPATGSAPLDVLFNGTNSSDTDGYITTYSWESGDGTSKSGSDAMIHHMYQNPGTYTATLTVTDNDGAVATAKHTITVTAPTAPLQILDWQLVPYDNMFMPWVVTGHAKNISGHTLNYVEVDAQFYDASNVLLTNWLDNMSNLPAGITWEFNIYCMDSSVAERVDHATVAVGTCY